MTAPPFIFDHLEPIVDVALATLRRDLNDTIDLINAAHDDFAIDHVPDDSYFPGGLAQPATFYPYLEVSASDQLVSAATVAQVAWTVSTTRLIIVAWCQHVDDEVLYRSQLRYGQAIMSVVAPRGALGDEVWTEEMQAVYRRRDITIEGSGEQMIGSVAIVCSLDGDEG